MLSSSTQPILITGATGTLGQASRRVCRIRGLPAVLLNRAALGIADAAAVARILRQHQLWAVVNAAGYVRVDEAETDAVCCYRANTTGPERLATACAQTDTQLLAFSLDLVFDGTQAALYQEDDAPKPLGVYGRSKLLAEQAVLTQLPMALVVCTSAFFSAWDEYNFVYFALAAARRGEKFAAADDLFITPTYVPDLVNAALDLLLDQAGGLWYLANQGTYSWAELARQALRVAGLDEALIIAQLAARFNWAARRPRHSGLGSHHGALLPSVESGLHWYLEDERLLSLAQPPAALGE